MPKHVPLAGELLEQVQAQRDWVKGHFASNAEQLYSELEQKLRVIDAILSNGWVQQDETWKLQSLGITLGDALAQSIDLDWVIVDDEYGRDPALSLPGTSILVFPLTMISKRIEDGEEVDVYDLFNGVIQIVSEAQAEGC